jgi:CheY-specific phosphatase CheX
MKMEREILTKAMRNSISEVLEKMFFLPLDFSDAGAPGDLWNAGGANLIAIRLAFKGPFSGHFAFFIPQALGKTLAADFMGTDEEGVSLAHVEQTAKEIVNMIAGSTFCALDEKAVFDLGIPEKVPSDEVWEGPGDSEEQVFLGIDLIDGRLGLRLVANGS